MYVRTVCFRVLNEFQTRSAHRIVIRDRDVFVWLLSMILIVAFYLFTWTALNAEYVKNTANWTMYKEVVLEENNVYYVTCIIRWWDHCIEACECACCVAVFLMCLLVFLSR